MGQASKIEWTDATWNPVRGCSRVSEGCRNCYAERQAVRFAGDGGPFQGFAKRVNGHAAWTGKVELVEKHLADPLLWKQPKRIFVNSMSDLFHESLPDRDLYRIFWQMAESYRRDLGHTFQILTKRPARMLDWISENVTGPAEFNNWTLTARGGSPLPNVWLGVSVEDQKTADERIPLLLQTPAAIRFVSYEPALGPVDFERFFLDGIHLRSRCIDWVIVGGESGPGARPFDIAWARNVVAQCKAAGVACFVKQIGAKPEGPQGCGDCDPCAHGQPCMLAYNVALMLKDRKGGDWSEWPADLRVRDFPEVHAHA